MGNELSPWLQQQTVSLPEGNWEIMEVHWDKKMCLMGDMRYSSPTIRVTGIY
jgi:hypothetical protein